MELNLAHRNIQRCLQYLNNKVKLDEFSMYAYKLSIKFEE